MPSLTLAFGVVLLAFSNLATVPLVEAANLQHGMLSVSLFTALVEVTE